jgi:hypothetical protein
LATVKRRITRADAKLKRSVSGELLDAEAAP